MWEVLIDWHLVVDISQFAEALDLVPLARVHPVGMLQLDHVTEVLNDLVK